MEVTARIKAARRQLPDGKVSVRSERRLSLIVDFNECWDLQAKIAIEEALRQRVPEPPQDQTWVISLATGLTQNYCEVQIKTPSQTRTRFFFEDPRHLPQAITEWIESYPLR
jgi:hypothetical protein